MGLTDKSIVCIDCGTTFILTAAQQERMASKGRTREPKRCPKCRKARRQQRLGERSVIGKTPEINIKPEITIKLETIPNIITPADPKIGSFRSRFGITLHRYQEALGRVDEANIYWVRGCIIRWDVLEPQDGQVKENWFEDTDPLVNAIGEHNKNLLCILAFGTKWWKNTGYDLSRFANYAKIVATHYKGKIKYYQIWNEENAYNAWDRTKKDNLGFNEPPNATRYAQLVKLTSQAIKKADPDAKVAIGGVTRIDSNYIEKLLIESVTDYVDVIAVHHYGIRLAEPPEIIIKEKIENLQTMVKKYTNKDFEYWITETGWRTSTEFDTLGVDELTQAKMFARTMLLALDIPIDKVFWYQIKDGSEDPGKREYFGILDYDFNPKPAYNVSKNLLGPLKHAERVKLTKTVSPPINNLQVHVYAIDNKLYLASWLAEDPRVKRQLKVEIVLEGTYQNIKKINLLNDERTELNYSESNGITIFNNLIISDMPFLIEMAKYSPTPNDLPRK